VLLGRRDVRDLDRFEAGEEVTPESLKAKGLIRSIRKDVKLLGVGELSKKLTVTVHAASATARAKVESAGGTLTLLKEPKVRRARPAIRLRRMASGAESEVQDVGVSDDVEGEGAAADDQQTSSDTETEE